MTDDEILETLDRRLAGVETRLPPTRVAPAADLVAVRTRLGGSLRPGAPALLVLAVVTAVAVGVGSRLSGGVGGEASPSVVDPSAVAIASDVPPSSAASSPSPTPVPSSSAADLEMIRDVNFDGMHVLTRRMGWGPCFFRSYLDRALPDGRAIDRAIDEAGVEQGFLDVGGGGRLWIGSTPESAARAYGSPILVIGRTGSWIVVDDDARGLIGREMLRIDTPKGRTAWYQGDMVGETACTDG